MSEIGLLLSVEKTKNRRTELIRLRRDSGGIEPPLEVSCNGGPKRNDLFVLFAFLHPFVLLHLLLLHLLKLNLLFGCEYGVDLLMHGFVN